MGWMAKGRVVVPVDFSGESEVAIHTALQMVAAPSDVHVIHVIVPMSPVALGAVWGTVTEVSREQQVRKSFATLLQEHGLGGVTIEVATGDPGLCIADFARRIGAELIVIPSHGYHGVKRLALGSVAERVIRHAHCAVMVLRRTDAD